MRNTIIQKLHSIEKEENIQILLAVESGSRAWGFASPDSDYDVRFIYKRDIKDYLKLNLYKDTLEYPVDDVLDISGWDLSKALKLMYSCNPSLCEWLSSPIVYIETDSARELRSLMYSYLDCSKLLHHYLSMARKNYTAYLTKDMVRAKKYFYVLRPILCCKWLLEYGSVPPMEFATLMEAELPTDLNNVVKHLLDIKISSHEIKEIPQIPQVHAYLLQNMQEIQEKISGLPPQQHTSIAPLNDVFLKEVLEHTDGRKTG